MQRLVLRDCNGAARSDVTPTAQQILDGLTVFGRPPVPGNSYEFVIRNSSAAAFAITLVAGTGVTLSPAAITVAQNNARAFMVIIDSTGLDPAILIYSLAGGASTHGRQPDRPAHRPPAAEGAHRAQRRGRGRGGCRGLREPLFSWSATAA